jgi:hypothetical protein
MHKVYAGLLAAMLLWPVAVTANPVVAGRYMPDAGKVGAGVLTYLFWDVYTATLYAPGSKWRSDAPFALTLRYMRDLKGRDIADRTIDEIRDQGFTDEAKLSDWATRLAALFPDVADGDSLTAVRDAAGRTLFYGASEQIGAIDDPEFGPRFFDIWLGEKTSEPKLRRQLLGG